jgi:hypothetical protein
MDKKKETKKVVKDEVKIDKVSSDKPENHKKKEVKVVEKKIKKLTAKEKQNHQLIWAIVLMISVIAIVILVPLIKYQFINKFVYANLDFQKTQAGDTIFYSTRIPVGDANGNVIGSFFINFHNDPRKLKDIGYKDTTTIPTFKRDKTVYISTGEMTRNCAEGTAAMLTLSGFLRQFALMNISAGISNEKIANETGFPYITCTDNPNQNTIINIFEGTKTEITQLDFDCYDLIFKDCEVMKVTERFILEIIEGYMKDFERDKKWWQIF